MAIVIKKDKSRESFDPAKMRKSIEAAAREAGLSKAQVDELVEKVSQPIIEAVEKENEIETMAVRDMILQALDTAEPSVSKSWRDYEQAKASKNKS